MKYVIIIPDGCADWAIESLGNRTPLQAAHIPNIQSLARSGIVGQSCNVPPGFVPGSDVATLGLLGYNPNLYYTGRASLEAVAQKIDLAENDWAIRCNLVTLRLDAPKQDTPQQDTIQSFTAGQISSSESAALLQTLNEKLAPASPFPLKFYPGVGYRNLAILQNCEDSPFDSTTKTSHPHDFVDKPLAEAIPAGKGSDLLLFLQEESHKLLKDHPVNQKRMNEGKLPATHIWLWGLGQKPKLPAFWENLSAAQPPQNGAMITAVDLLRGIAALIGWDIIEVPGITGYFDTDYAAKGRYAAEALKQYDIVCVHIEAPDEAGHEGNVEKKIKTLEDIDALTLPPILEALRSYGQWRVFISPDHPTPCALKTHTSEPVPWLLAGSDISAIPNSTASDSAAPKNIGGKNFDEESSKDSAYQYERGWEMIELLFR